MDEIGILSMLCCNKPERSSKEKVSQTYVDVPGKMDGIKICNLSND
jgi:hypothetical protein